ncbi:hypothetical protein [uncultured Porticoccus sp.]|uniref:hypothetical protein n=1 Tax=uncultured Porticoccus sp. TaxID=1256050 RepID=UPI00262CA851|nr:hypothetical protein [uncultured Porticoccus sp.]
MNFDQLTDKDIDDLIKLPKRISNPSARWQEKPGHKQRNFNIVAENHSFTVYQRQNLFDDKDFSCGLKVIKPDGQPLTLLRYNGGGHIHGDIQFACHIHSATEKAILAGRKPESHAEATALYRTLEGALACLLEDARIRGLSNVKKDEPDLFESE